MRGTASAGAMARLLTVCAVLIGLFLMHGLPAQACPAGTAMSAVTTGHAEHPVLGLGAHGDQAAHGTPCVFTPAPRGIDAMLTLLLLLASAVVLVSPPRPALVGDRHPRRHRAPPRTGEQLLTRLCVSRT